jgi:hypothetical protein
MARNVRWNAVDEAKMDAMPLWIVLAIPFGLVAVNLLIYTAQMARWNKDNELDDLREEVAMLRSEVDRLRERIEGVGDIGSDAIKAKPK